MGDSFGDGESARTPGALVELDAFYIAKFEVTNGEWKKFRDDPGYDEPRFWPEGRVVPKDQVPYWCAGQQPRRRDTRQRQLPAARRELGFGGRLLQLAEREDRQEVPLADRGRVGEGRARDGPAALPVGQRDRPFVRQLRRRAGVSTPAGRSGSTTAASAASSRRTATRRRTGRSTWRATSWSGARTGTAATTTPSPRARTRRARRPAPTASCAAGRSSSRRSTCARYTRSAAWPSFQGHRMIGFRAVREP